MATTAHDWRVTAYLEAKRAIAALDGANEEEPKAAEAPLLSRAEILDRYWSAAQAAAAAAGALIAAELQAGMTWREVAQALGYTDVATARQALGPALAVGADRLRQRLPDA
jgi:hypothetical protein